MILGLHGISRSGKDTVARILRDNHGYEWRSFADKLRQILLDINPYLREMDQHLREAVEKHGWDVVKSRSDSAVDMMIRLGQSARDNLDEHIWVSPVLSGQCSTNIVVSDVRQPNEYNAITALGGEVWKIVRPTARTRGMDGLLDYNVDFPVTIYNNGSIDDLEDIVGKVMENAPNRWSGSR